MQKDKIEVEMRAKISPQIAQKITSISYKEYIEHDIYFTYKADKNPTWIARIRERNDIFKLTLKSKNSFGEGAWDEVETDLTAQQASQFRQFFLANGFFIDVEIKKVRKSYKIGDFEINIDKINKLGTYIEAELMVHKEDIDKAKNKIREFLLNLGVSENQIISKGYVGLMRDINQSK